MPTYVYNALDLEGRSAQGTLSADTRAAALAQIAQRGLTPVRLDAAEEAVALHAGSEGWRRPGLLAARKVKAAHVEAFTRELANLLAAGVPLGRALAVLRREAGNVAAKAQWSAIYDDVVGGHPLAEAMARWPASFPPVYIAMVHAGETGGFLDVVLNQIADFRAREGELKGRVKAAMVYPIVLAVVATAVMIFMLTFFIPRFSGIFTDLGGSLPLLTQGIIAASKLVTSYGPVLLVVAVVLGLLLRRAMRSESGRRTVERLLLRTPALGTIAARFALVRFSRMLGTLLGAGVPMVTALRVAREAIGNQTLSDAVHHAVEEVKRGTALSRSLGQCTQLFPPSVTEMVAVAEESGRLDKELLRLAQSYELELDRRLRMLVALAEPLLLFVMAALIGTMVVGMLLPIFTLQELIK
ncbi:MAG: type II secretion system F family protein [Phycisphaeraceae bacterium]